MSAFIVNENHIHAIVTAAKMDRDFSYYFNGSRHKCDTIEEAEKMGQTLINQNYRSVNHRYDEKDVPYKYELSYNTHFKPIEIIKACQCYIYQSCETDDYKETQAIAIAKGIINSQIHKLPGYDNAAWEITEMKSENMFCITDMM